MRLLNKGYLVKKKKKKTRKIRVYSIINRRLHHDCNVENNEIDTTRESLPTDLSNNSAKKGTYVSYLQSSQIWLQEVNTQ